MTSTVAFGLSSSVRAWGEGQRKGLSPKTTVSTLNWSLYSQLNATEQVV